MSDLDLVVVFDLLDAGYKDWWFPAFGLIFVGIGFVMVRFPQTVMQLFNQTNPRFYKFFSWSWLGFAVFWTVLAFIWTYGSYQLLRSAYIGGSFDVVEGSVENFVPMSSSEDQVESFTVAGQEFSYSDYIIVPGFNRSRSFGGPIEAGIYVRVFHINGDIVRLEVERSAAQAERAVQYSPFAPPDDVKLRFPEGSTGAYVFRYSELLFVVFIAAIAATWRWRGRPHIARDPSLRAGYNRMTLGFAVWVSVPFFAGAVAPMFGETIQLGPVKGISTSTFVAFAYVAVVAKWVYWTFFQDGAAKMAKHPGLIDNEWVAKFWPLAVVSVYSIALVISFF